MGKLSDLFVKLRLDNKQYNSELNESGKKTSSFGKGVAKISGLIAGAFAVGQIVSFGKELIELGGVAEGVRSAFERIAPAGTMNDLKEATAGTVSELELMKRAVSAKNLGLPVENLASLFEFATKRAQETGESVDFLVNSIVTGIGRKSPLILDNLGISAVDLREKLKGVGMETASVADIAAAVGEIAADSMAESGGIIDTNAVKTAALGAKWDDFKLKISETPLVINKVSDSIDTLDKALTILESEHLSFWEKINIFESQDKTFDTATKRLEEYNSLAEKSTTELNKLLDAETKRHDTLSKSGGDFEVYLESARALTRLRESIDDINKKRQESINHVDEESNAYRNQIAAESESNEEKKKHIRTIGELRAETDELKKSIELYNEEQGAEIQRTLAQIEANEKLIKSLTTLRTARSEAPAPMETRGDIPQIGMPIDSESGLANMESFYARMDEQLENFTAEYWANYNMFLDGLNEMTEAGVEDLVATFAEGLGRLAVGDIGLDQFFSVMLNSIGSFLGQMGKMLIAYGVGMTAFKKAFVNPVAAIAAGVALVAIGGAISGFASRGPSGVGGGGGASVGGQAFNVITTDQQDKQLVAQVSGNQLNFVLTKYNTNQNRV